MDGLYTFELAGEGETKVSCPSVAPGLSQPTKSPTQEPLEPLNIGLYPSYPFHHSPLSPAKPVVPHNPKPVRHPFQIEAVPAHVRQPVYSLFPVPRPETKPNDKLTPHLQPLQAQTPDTPSYLFPYPFYTTPAPVANPVQKPTPAPQPHRPEVPPGHVEKPYYHFLPENKPSKDTKSVPSLNPPKTQQPEVPSGNLEEPYYPFLPKPHPEYNPSKDIKTVPSAHTPKRQQPEFPGHVKPYYPFLPNPQAEFTPQNKPSKNAKKAPSPQPPKPQPPDVPSGYLQKPYYSFLPNSQTENKQSTDTKTVPSPQQAEVQPGQGAQPASPNQPLQTPKAKPTLSPQLTQPQNPEAPTVRAGQPLYPYLSSFFPDPDNEPQPSQPEEPEKPPGKVQQPVNYFPSNPMLGPGPKPNDKHMTASQQPNDPLDQIEQPTHPHTYPLYPLPRPKEPTKTTPNPQKPEVTPGQIQQPPNPYFYPLNSTPRPKEPTRKPMPKPKITTGPVQQPPNPYTYPFYPMLSPKEPTEKPLPHPYNPEVPSSPVEQPTDPYPYPLYPIPKEPAKKPMLELWPFKPQIPEVPPGSVKQPTDPYPYPLYPKPGLKQPAKKPMPNPWLFKPQQPKFPPGQVKQPADPYHFPPYPRPSPKKTAKKPVPDPWTFKSQDPEAPQSHVAWPVYPLWHQNKPVAKPVQHPQTPVFPPSLVSQPHNPYLVYPVPSLGELPKKPMTFPQPPDSKQPEVPGPVQQPAYPYYPINVGPVKSSPAPLKPEVPGNVYWPLKPQTPVKHISTHLFKHTTQKPAEGEKLSPIQSPESKMPPPQWEHNVTLPPAKEPQQATPLLQSTNGAVVPQGSASGCFQICAVGFSNCCPQITLHQHLYLSSPGPADKVTHKFPFLASMAYYGPRNGMGYKKKPEKNPEKNVDSVPNEKQPYHQSSGSNTASLLGSIPNKVAAPERPSYPYLAFKPNSQYSRWLYENSPNLAPSQLSPQVMPFRVQNRFYSPLFTPVNQEAQNEHPKTQNYQHLPRVINYPSGLNARSNIDQYLQQHNPNRMPIPREFSYGSDRPSRSEVQDGLSPLLPYSMLNDAEATKNTSFLQNLPQSSHWNKPKKSSKRDQTDHSSDPKGYVLLQRGPPGKAPRWSVKSKNFKVGVHDQNVPVQHFARHQHVNTWNRKALLGKGLTESSRNHFKLKKTQTNAPLVLGPK
ncbi:uncharacterized protein LOC133411813 [Phycodurus eques]|uniref:uncharacterized protein LOC133411813 n=1 Tax=Phycodurus eques TaxID=693459 RepID=UPI002ACD6263|nr:uncharacterized protein LOC133411813 [Phycodurus eques]